MDFFFNFPMKIVSNHIFDGEKKNCLVLRLYFDYGNLLCLIHFIELAIRIFFMCIHSTHSIFDYVKYETGAIPAISGMDNNSHGFVVIIWHVNDSRKKWFR